MRPPGRGKMMETYKVEEREEESCGGEPREASPRGTSVLPVALMLMCLCQSTQNVQHKGSTLAEAEDLRNEQQETQK